MFIYNVTIKVDESIRDEWLKWIKEDHIPKVMDTGCFVKHQLVKLIGVDEQEGPTYAVQYYADTFEKYEKYISDYATELRKESLDMWGDSFIAFRTLMEVVE